MRDSSVVYINEALDYYFSLYFSFILGFLQLFFFTVLRSVFLILPLHNKSLACNLIDSCIP